MTYFSEREFGGSPREGEGIGANVWRGLLAAIRSRATDGSFGVQYPDMCDDGPVVCGADIGMFEDAMLSEVPGLAGISDRNSGYRQSILEELARTDNQPSTLTILDLIEFCWKSLGKPTKIHYHSFFSHHHLTFDEEAGRDEFRDQVETIFRRNGIAYTLTEIGRIERLVPRALEGALVGPESNTGDAELDRLIGTAQRKFLDPNPETRQEALEALWDAWERLKTLDGQGDKRARAAAMLDKTAGKSSPKFRDALDREAIALTDIGNNLRIRHSETNQEIIATSGQIDYLFYRLVSLIQLVLRSRSSSEVET